MVILDNWQNTCTGGVVGDRRVIRTRCSDDSTGLSWYGLELISLKCSMSLKCCE